MARPAGRSLQRRLVGPGRLGAPADVNGLVRWLLSEEAAYVTEVAEAKTAALRMSLKAVEDDGMPLLGETAR